jgi:small multidrug resistance pump
MSHWLWLSIAIVTEVIGTTALRYSEGFTRPWPTLAVAVSYAIAFYCLSLTLKTLPVGIAYAVWSGVGLALIALIGWLVLKQPLDVAAIAGIGLIGAGVLVLTLVSKSVPH